MISLRKINSILVLIMILMLLNHAVLSVLYLYGIINYSLSFQITGRRLFYPLVLHILISVYLFVKDRRKVVRIYPNLISDTTKQFVTGIGIVVFVSLHIILYMVYPINSNFDVWIRLVHFLIDIFMFVSISMHLMISIPRLGVSLGFLENKNSYSNFKEKFNWIMYVIMVLLILAEIIHYWVVI